MVRHSHNWGAGGSYRRPDRHPGWRPWLCELRLFSRCVQPFGNRQHNLTKLGAWLKASAPVRVVVTVLGFVALERIERTITVGRGKRLAVWTRVMGCKCSMLLG